MEKRETDCRIGRRKLRVGFCNLLTYFVIRTDGEKVNFENLISMLMVCRKKINKKSIFLKLFMETRKVRERAQNDEERSRNCVCTEPLPSPVYDSPLLFIFNSSLFLYSLFIVYHSLTFRVCPVLSNRILVFYILCNRQCITGARSPNAGYQTLVLR